MIQSSAISEWSPQVKSKNCLKHTNVNIKDIALPFSDVSEPFDVAQNMIIRIRLGNAAQNIINEETKEQKKRRNKKANRQTC